jgi:hypothetical protein
LITFLKDWLSKISCFKRDLSELLKKKYKSFNKQNVDEILGNEFHIDLENKWITIPKSISTNEQEFEKEETKGIQIFGQLDSDLQDFNNFLHDGEISRIYKLFSKKMISFSNYFVEKVIEDDFVQIDSSSLESSSNMSSSKLNLSRIMLSQIESRANLP